MHSTASDGAHSPAEVVSRASSGRLDVIALSDHDTVAGVAEAREAARALVPEGRRGVEVIPALEVSTTWDDYELHFLGYFVDVGDSGLIRHGERARNRRMARMEEMVSRLDEQGIDVPLAAVLEAAGPEQGSVGRPHLARALIDGGHVRSVQEAFDRFIGNDHDAFVPTLLLEPAGGIELILAAGGIPVWAHPPDFALDALLPEMVEAGLRGLEVYRPKSSARRVLALEKRAKDAGLLVTGGSDWHSGENGKLGEFHVSSDEVQEFLAEGGL
jgi:predicted metal-dependent phosphoesterase TrpH